MTKTGSTNFENFITPGEEIFVLECDYISHTVKMLYCQVKGTKTAYVIY